MKFHNMLGATTIPVIIVLLTTAMRPLAPLAPLGATINVNTTVDELDTIGNGFCSLREAVQSANTNSDTGGCTHSGLYGHDTIRILSAGTYEVNRGTEPTIAEDANVFGDLDIIPNPSFDINPYDVTIEGIQAATTILDGDYKDRLIDIQANAAVKLVDIQIYHGRPAAADGKNGNGCGIYNHGTLWIEDSIVANNISLTNQNLSIHAGDGGGIWSDGELTIKNTSINNNAAAPANNGQDGGDGGGIFIAAGSGTVTITDSTIKYNSAGSTTLPVEAGNGGRGAGIFNAGEDTHLETSVIHQNYAGQAHSTTGDGGDGGGIYNYQGTMTITNSTLYFNSSGMSEFATSGSGAGLANYGGEVNLHESTLAFNRIEVGISYGSGGGIESSADNTLTTLHNTLMYLNNRYNAPPADQYTDCHTGAAESNVFEARYSLIYNMSDCSLDVNESNLLEISAYLNPFGYNGGPTQTIPFRPGSPGIDDGDPADCPATDQRGWLRPQDGDNDGTASCDIGAYEYSGLRDFLPLILK